MTQEPFGWAPFQVHSNHKVNPEGWCVPPRSRSPRAHSLSQLSRSRSRSPRAHPLSQLYPQNQKPNFEDGNGPRMWSAKGASSPGLRRPVFTAVFDTPAVTKVFSWLRGRILCLESDRCLGVVTFVLSQPQKQLQENLGERYRAKAPAVTQGRPRDRHEHNWKELS